ncbi:PQQ-binding-like beta-propeller repeat protein [bacterium AH-315-N03]|nr:PQQ-binding-like beta-propeller repeat protein [bacterium AH-315-N03]
MIGVGVLAVVLVSCGVFALIVVSGLGATTGGGGWSRGPDFTGMEPLVHCATAPILADIDGDGIQDVIGSGATTERLLIAASGARADTLWTFPLPDSSISESQQSLTFAAPTHQLVLHIDHRGTTTAIDGRTGQERWRTDLGERMQRNQPLPCVTSDAAYVRSPEDYWIAIDLESGTHRDASPPDGACDPQRPLGFRARNEQRRDDSTGWERSSVRVNLTGDSARRRRGWLLPEQPRLLVEGLAQEPNGRSVAVLALFETQQDRHGRARADEPPLWQTFVAQRPEVTVTDGVRNLTAHGHHLFVVYDMVRSRAGAPERVAAFDLRTGARLWDTALERNTGRVFFLYADAHRVWVGHQALEILDRRTGEHLGRVGRWY